MDGCNSNVFCVGVWQSTGVLPCGSSRTLCASISYRGEVYSVQDIVVTFIIRAPLALSLISLCPLGCYTHRLMQYVFTLWVPPNYFSIGRRVLHPPWLLIGQWAVARYTRELQGVSMPCWSPPLPPLTTFSDNTTLKA